MELVEPKYYISYISHMGDKRRKYYFHCPHCKNNVFRYITRGKTNKSCGCNWTQNMQNNSNYKHGGSDTKLHYIWRCMRQRCNNTNNIRYKYYGGKTPPIKICKVWDDFAVFRTFAENNGYEEGLTIDRIDNNLGYSPNNCQFLTQSENTKKMNRDKRSHIAIKPS